MEKSNDALFYFKFIKELIMYFLRRPMMLDGYGNDGYDPYDLNEPCILRYQNRCLMLLPRREPSVGLSEAEATHLC